MDYVHEVEHLVARIARLEQAITEAAANGAAADARGDRGLAGAARHCAGHGGDDRR